MDKISRPHALAILERIRLQYASYLAGAPAEDGPRLRDSDHEELREGCWSIDWEEGPYEWALDFAGEVRLPGVLVEPINSFVLGIYPA
ncbi:hypothetical protein SEA_ALTADENA_74 [Arthrobacter phage Altadena]|uniref:Uncharacterized protein n=1 Tax=Arthrobacter phage Altadena TaxID=3059064 RepID=A0AA96HUH7_9CAUD|nr:hypothetical protein SEA_ALTADENA_74 [Arthrobacter phage Altadena]